MRFPPFDDEEPPLDYADNLLEVDPLEVRGGGQQGVARAITWRRTCMHAAAFRQAVVVQGGGG